MGYNKAPKDIGLRVTCHWETGCISSYYISEKLFPKYLMGPFQL